MTLISRGTIANRRLFATTPDATDLPDSLTSDDKDFLWSASWGGAKVTRYDPDGNIERVIHLPVPYVTSCAFGGPDRNELFITSAHSGLGAEGRQRYPLAGDLFHIQTEITGHARPKFPG